MEIRKFVKKMGCEQAFCPYWFSHPGAELKIYHPHLSLANLGSAQIKVLPFVYRPDAIVGNDKRYKQARVVDLI